MMPNQCRPVIKQMLQLGLLKLGYTQIKSNYVSNELCNIHLCAVVHVQVYVCQYDTAQFFQEKM